MVVTNIVSTGLPDAIQMSAHDVLCLSVLATAGLFVMWAVFWLVVLFRKESISEIVVKPEFFQIVTVMGVIAATVVLSLANRLDGNLTAAILSGIAGYVLGSVSHKAKEDKKTNGNTKSGP